MGTHVINHWWDIYLYYMYIYIIYYTYVLIDGNNFPWFPWNISPKLSPKNIARSGFWSCWRLSLGRMVGDWTMTGWFFHSVPIGSMYAIYGNIYHQYTPNVSIYTIHGSYGIYKDIYIQENQRYTVKPYCFTVKSKMAMEHPPVCCYVSHWNLHVWSFL